MHRTALTLAVLLAAAPAGAEVLESGPSGFALESRVTVPAAPADAYAALGRVGAWWNSAHSFSGDAANMTLEPRAGGCFCEAIPADGGSVEHGRVVYARPGQALRVRGALGPLQGGALVGTLTWALRPGEGGGTEIVQTYVVGGYIGGGAAPLAPVVDRVMAGQLERLRAYLSR